VAVGTAVAAAAAVVYTYTAHKQLGKMQETLEEMRKSGQSSTSLANQVIGNMNWLAKGLDGSVQQNQRAMDKQFALMAGQLDTMRRQLEATDRPWIKVDPSVASPLTFTARGNLQAAVTLTLKNIGRSVAVNVTVYVDAFIARPDGYVLSDLPLRRQKELCGTPKSPPFQVTMFPEDIRPFSVPITIQREEIEANAVTLPPGAGWPPSAGKPVYPVLVGCAYYQFAQFPDQHHTDFIYSIVGHASSDPKTPRLVITGHDLAVEDVGLERWPRSGGDFAN
jgi:hypothetical protein